jgi:hypothetical protein
MWSLFLCICSAGPHGSYKSQWLVPCRALWFLQVSVTGTLQGPMVPTSLSDWYLAGPYGSYKSQWLVPCRALWFIQVSVTGTLQGPMVHTGLSDWYLAGPDASYRYQWLVPCRAPWFIQVSVTGTLQDPMVHTSLSDWYLAGPYGSYKYQWQVPCRSSVIQSAVTGILICIYEVKETLLIKVAPFVPLSSDLKQVFKPVIINWEMSYFDVHNHVSCQEV